MMNNPNKLSTLDRIQLEIKESLEREQQLKYDYNNKIIKPGNSIEDSTDSSVKSSEIDTIESSSSSTTKLHNTTNGFRKFFRNTNSSKGVMQKFLKSRGRISLSSNRNNNDLLSNDIWTSDAAFKPAKITVQKGGTKSIRNGYVSAEEKMRKELQEFQQRETQLREERKKSLPNLMASLHLEELQEQEANNNNNNNGYVTGDFYTSNNGFIKATKSMANIYNHSNSDDGFEDTNSSAGGSLKPARSLAELCDVSDDECCDLPGTHSLIMRFENMKFKNKSHQ